MPRITKPKPCPFCASTRVYMERGSWDYSYIHCDECGAHGPALIEAWDDDDKDTAKAMRLWNGRKRGSRQAASQ